MITSPVKVASLQYFEDSDSFKNIVAPTIVFESRKHSRSTIDYTKTCS
jgi:hypothetical protein